MNQRKLPVIARIGKQPTNCHVTYTCIDTNEFDHVILYLIENDGQVSLFRNQLIHGKLQFKRMRKLSYIPTYQMKAMSVNIFGYGRR